MILCYAIHSSFPTQCYVFKINSRQVLGAMPAILAIQEEAEIRRIAV
jgi:hypothetical protein